MRSSIIIGVAVLGCLAAPAAAQVYTMPANPYRPTQGYVYGFPAIPQHYDRGDWLRECRDSDRDRRRRSDRRRDCEEWLDHYERSADYGYDYYDGGYAYRDGYRNGGSYSYGYPGGPTYGGGYGYGYGQGYGGGYSGGYSGGYAGGYSGGTVTTGGVVVIVEQERGERYVPVIREEIIEETYETTEYETVRETVIVEVPRKHHPKPRKDKYIKYIKGD